MNISFKKTEVEGVYLIKSDSYKDERGFFSRVFDNKSFNFIKKNIIWNQCNISINPKQYTFRGWDLEKGVIETIDYFLKMNISDTYTERYFIRLKQLKYLIKYLIKNNIINHNLEYNNID